MPWARVLVVALGFALAACAVRESSPDGITIEHSAQQPFPAERQAAQHCARYGKRAVLESQTPVAASANFLGFRARTSTFACVE